LFKQKVVSHKNGIVATATLHNHLFVIDSLTIFTAQIVHSHRPMYWRKICLHSLADQNVHRLEKMFSTKYHTKETWTVALHFKIAHNFLIR